MTLSPSRGRAEAEVELALAGGRLGSALDDRRRRLDAAPCGLRVRAGAPAAQPGQLGAGQVPADPLLARRPAPPARPGPPGSRRTRRRGRSRGRDRARGCGWSPGRARGGRGRPAAARRGGRPGAPRASAMASMSRWFVGSSRISSTSSPASPGGPTSTSARASATRFVSPPDSVAVAVVEAPAEVELVEDRRGIPAVRPVTSPIVAPPSGASWSSITTRAAPTPADDAGLGLERPGQLAQQRRLARSR